MGLHRRRDLVPRKSLRRLPSIDKDRLEQLPGGSVRVQPILTLPGWMAITPSPGEAVVLTPTPIPADPASHGAPVPTSR